MEHTRPSVFEERVMRLMPILERNLLLLDDLLRAGTAVDDGEKGMVKTGKVLG